MISVLMSVLRILAIKNPFFNQTWTKFVVLSACGSETESLERRWKIK